MSQQKPVLVIGDVCADLVAQVSVEGSYHNFCPEPEMYGGGTGANTAVALARLGVPTAFMGTIGDDGYGRFLKADLEAEGVDTTHVVKADDAFTTLVLALVHPHGERALLPWPARGGAHIYLYPEQVTEEIISQASWVHTTGMCMVESPARDALLRGMALAREQGVPVSFDLNLRLGFETNESNHLPAAYLETIHTAISLSDFVLGSAGDEFAYLTPGGRLEDALQQIRRENQVLIVRLGRNGVMAVSGRDRVTVPSFPVTVVDAIGAGDAFNAGFIAATLEQRNLATAVRWGNAVAALKLGRPSARGLPRRAEVEALLAR